jgi:hypothetical protein
MITAVIALSISNAILLVLWLVTQFVVLSLQDENKNLETELTKNNDEICALLDALHDSEVAIHRLKN